MAQSTSMKLFEDKNIRTLWDEENEKWFFSVHDVIAILTNQLDYEKVRNYWKWLRNKLKQEGSQLGSNTTQLKLQAADGKFYMTDVADVVISSIDMEDSPYFSAAVIAVSMFSFISFLLIMSTKSENDNV